MYIPKKRHNGLKSYPAFCHISAASNVRIRSIRAFITQLCVTVFNILASLTILKDGNIRTKCMS